MVTLRKKGGFTLMEVVIVSALVSIIALVAPRLFLQLMRFYQVHNARVEVQRDGRVSMDIIGRFLRQGASATVVIDQAPGQPPYSRISFKNPAGQTVQIYQQNNQLIESYLTNNALSNNLQQVIFTYPNSDDPTLISISLTLARPGTPGIGTFNEIFVQNVRVMN